jgi:hypothetical protein
MGRDILQVLSFELRIRVHANGRRDQIDIAIIVCRCHVELRAVLLTLAALGRAATAAASSPVAGAAV